MNVTNLIDTVSQFAFGTFSTDGQRRDYLRCLNFVNNDLYLKIRNYKSFLIYKEIKVEFANNVFSIPFDFKSGILKSIYNKDIKLNCFDLLTKDDLQIGDLEYFPIYSENKIILGAKDYNRDNDGDFSIKLFYTKPLKTLVEVVSNADLETDEHMFGSFVDQLFILGAVYYIYLGTNGQINKLDNAYKLYKDKLDDVLNFFNDL